MHGITSGARSKLQHARARAVLESARKSSIANIVARMNANNVVLMPPAQGARLVGIADAHHSQFVLARSQAHAHYLQVGINAYYRYRISVQEEFEEECRRAGFDDPYSPTAILPDRLIAALERLSRIAYKINARDAKTTAQAFEHAPDGHVEAEAAAPFDPAAHAQLVNAYLAAKQALDDTDMVPVTRHRMDDLRKNYAAATAKLRENETAFGKIAIEHTRVTQINGSHGEYTDEDDHWLSWLLPRGTPEWTTQRDVLDRDNLEAARALMRRMERLGFDVRITFAIVDDVIVATSLDVRAPDDGAMDDAIRHLGRLSRDGPINVDSDSDAKQHRGSGDGSDDPGPLVVLADRITDDDWAYLTALCALPRVARTDDVAACLAMPLPPAQDLFRRAWFSEARQSGKIIVSESRVMATDVDVDPAKVDQSNYALACHILGRRPAPAPACIMHAAIREALGKRTTSHAQLKLIYALGKRTRASAELRTVSCRAVYDRVVFPTLVSATSPRTGGPKTHRGSGDGSDDPGPTRREALALLGIAVDPYEGTMTEAIRDVYRRAYKVQALHYHPDKAPAGSSAAHLHHTAERFKAIKNALDALLSDAPPPKLDDTRYDECHCLRGRFGEVPSGSACPFHYGPGHPTGYKYKCGCHVRVRSTGSGWLFECVCPKHKKKIAALEEWKRALLRTCEFAEEAPHRDALEREESTHRTLLTELAAACLIHDRIAYYRRIELCCMFMAHETAVRAAIERDARVWPTDPFITTYQEAACAFEAEFSAHCSPLAASLRTVHCHHRLEMLNGETDARDEIAMDEIGARAAIQRAWVEARQIRRNRAAASLLDDYGAALWCEGFTTMYENMWASVIDALRIMCSKAPVRYAYLSSDVDGISSVVWADTNREVDSAPRPLRSRLAILRDRITAPLQRYLTSHGPLVAAITVAAHFTPLAPLSVAAAVTFASAAIAWSPDPLAPLAGRPLLHQFPPSDFRPVAAELAHCLNGTPSVYAEAMSSARYQFEAIVEHVDLPSCEEEDRAFSNLVSKRVFARDCSRMVIRRYDLRDTLFKRAVRSLTGADFREPVVTYRSATFSHAAAASAYVQAEDAITTRNLTVRAAARELGELKHRRHVDDGQSVAAYARLRFMVNASRTDQVPIRA